MKKVRLLGICCNWSPFACYNAAGMAQMKMPDNFRLIRVMCIGRINQALILRAFEYGADGVILLECNDEDCRYGPGPEIGHENVNRVRKLLHLLGIDQERLVEKSFAAHEREELVTALWDFVGKIEALGPVTEQEASAKYVSLGIADDVMDTTRIAEFPPRRK